MFTNQFISFGLTLIIALTWLRINDFFAHKGWISSRISIKIIHIGTGPIFVLCWLFFKESRFSPFLAAIIPFGITLQFGLIGLGILKDPSTVDALSRSGDRREILLGPLFYGMVFVLLTILFWRRSPTGIVALMIMCGGDGLADIVGMKVGGYKLPWSSKKTLIGSLSMLLGGFSLSIFILWVFITRGYFLLSISHYILPVGLIAITTTLVESFPFRDIDNLTVPLTAIIIGMFVF